MKAFWKDLLYSCLMGLILPGMILSVGVVMFENTDETEAPTVSEILQDSPQRMIRVLSAGEVVEMGLEDYLTGVVLAEMPASFELEAQKAQAVVARTYAMRFAEGNPRHKSAVVCTDSTCCQGYISQEDYLAKGGTEEGIGQIRRAVLDTAGLVLTYEGALIEATYFSCSGGNTEDAVAVWGMEVPYLKSVVSPGEEEATHYTDTVTFTAQEFADALFLELTGDPRYWIGETTYTAGGGVYTMMIGGQVFRGTELRKLLGLRSTAFWTKTDGESITVTTKGYGHRVGMSQYGADAMAASGSSFDQILVHYYQGVVLEQMQD